MVMMDYTESNGKSSFVLGGDCPFLCYVGLGMSQKAPPLGSWIIASFEVKS